MKLRFLIVLVVSCRCLLLAGQEAGSVVERKLVQANECLQKARLNEARSLADEVLQSEPGNAAALEIKGNVQFLQGSTGEAINTFIGLLEQHPENRDAPYMLGRIYYSTGNVEAAIGQFERVLRLDPRSYKAYDNLGLCYAARGDNEKAQRYLLTAIKLAEKYQPHYDAAYADMAEMLLRQGDARMAFGAASKAADRNPQSARNFYLGGRALEELGKTELCINWLERSAALDPHYAEPQYALARVYRRLGQEEKAAAAQQRFLNAKNKN